MARDSIESLRAALDAVAADLAALREQLTARVGVPDPAGGNGVLTSAAGAVSWQPPAAPPAPAWGSIGGNIASQLDLQNALNGKGGLAASNSWSQPQTMNFGAHDRVYFAPNMGALDPETNNGGAMYFGVGVTGPAVPTAGIETSWGGGTHPQMHLGVIRGGRKAWVSLYSGAGLGFGVSFGHGSATWLNLHSAGAAFTYPVSAPGFAVPGAVAGEVLNANGTRRRLTVSTALPTGGSDGDVWFRV